MLNTTQRLTKIAIIGTGRVGATCAYALQLRGLASEIVLINANRQHAEGEAMDINHGSQFTKPVRVWDAAVTAAVFGRSSKTVSET